MNLHKHFQPKTTLGELLPIYSEGVVRRCSIKKVFLEISQNSLENTCSRVSFLISCRPLVAAASLLFNNIFLIADFQNLFDHEKKFDNTLFNRLSEIYRR